MLSPFSWKLWRALQRPPLQSPLFRRAYTRQQPRRASAALPNFIPLMGWFRAISLIVLPVVLVLIGVPVLVLTYSLSLAIAPLLLPLVNTVYGLNHAISASGGIVRERERQTYDILCTALPGSLGTHWSYCTGWLHYHAVFRAVLLAALMTGILASILGVSPQLIFGGEPVPLWVNIDRAAALGVLFLIDYAQTSVLSSLTALLIPVYAETESNARLWAAALFLALQATVYGTTLIMTTFALPECLQLVGIDPVLAALLIPPLGLAFFVITREALITALWRTVELQLNTNTMELDAFTGRTL